MIATELFATIPWPIIGLGYATIAAALCGTAEAIARRVFGQRQP